jgi:acyl-CoA thioester hydrolase
MRIHIPIHLRWADLDAYNHLNNVEMLRLLEEARVRMFWVPGSGDELLPTAVLDAGAHAGADTHSLIAHHEIEYLKPLSYQRQPVDVQVWIGGLGGASVKVSYEVYAGDPAVLYARAATTMVIVDATTGRPRRINDLERAAWTPYVEEPVVFTRRG